MVTYEKPAASDERARIVEEIKQVEKELAEAKADHEPIETIKSLNKRRQELSAKLFVYRER